MDGVGASDGGRVGSSTRTWNSLAGAMVDEHTVFYSSREAARKDFLKELEGSEKIIELTNIDDSTGVDQRIVKVLGDPATRQGAAKITTLRGSSINCIEASSLKSALDFEESWLKLWSRCNLPLLI